MANSSIRLNDGRLLGYTEYGDPEGAVVIYCHGFPGSRLDWLMFDGPTVADSGARIIAIDRPGYGLSDPEPKRTLMDWPSDVKELADQLGVDRFAVLGISGGGPYALACASALPDRVAAAGVVCGMGPLDAPGMKDGTSWKIPGTHRILRRILISLMSLGLSRDPDKFVASSKDTFASVDAVLLDIPEVADAFVAALEEALRQGTGGATDDAALYARPWGFALEEIQIPVHIWHGDLDLNVPVSVGRFVAAALPGCSASFHEEEGHLTLPRKHIGDMLEALCHQLAAHDSTG